MSIKIGQASLGETGGRNQQPGNQTGRELNFAYWYSGSWLGVLRFKDRRKAELAAQACEAGVGNKNIGYDQDGRNTAYIRNQLQEDYTDDQLSIKEFVDPFTGEPVRGGK